MRFSDAIITWYEDHKRTLPWRDTVDPYKIWLSEIILQQTRVAQGLPYYHNFVDQYPTVQDLADAPEDDVMRLWQGLGYYSRARNLHYTAKEVATLHKGNFPNTYKELLKLKGVGAYTAAAISSFAFGESVAVLDGNVYRVLARYLGNETDISSSKAQSTFSVIAQNLIDEDRPGTYNQAIMEFGALHCTPKKPNCLFCPVNLDCVASSNGTQESLPIKTKKIKKKTRYFRYCIFKDGGKVLVRKRDKKDIWGGLYDFYLIQSPTKKELDLLQEEDELLIKNEKKILLHKVSEVCKHILTHQKLMIAFWHYEVKEEMMDIPEGYSFVDINTLEDLAKPIIIANYLSDHPI